jgi:hypothetical protein
MVQRVTFADLLKKAEEKKKIEKPQFEVVSNEKPATPPTLPTPRTPLTHRTSPTPPTQNKKLPIAPERDFAKVANSIVRDAVSQGFFIGKSKQIYDYLYLYTRGAIQPKRSMRITKLNLMRGSDIGSERTLLKNLNHLKSIGLVKITEFDGQHGGNEYEVFLPEETNATPPTLPMSGQSLYPPQKVVTVPPLESGVGGVSQTEVNKGFSGSLRLNTKTNTTDDESALAIFIEKVSKASEKVVGRKLNPREAEKWGSLADLLILELEVAAKRTNSISSVPAFLTEVLRRQFFASRQQAPSSTKPSRIKADTVGKADNESFEIKPLNKKAREAALEQLRDFAEDDFLQDFKKWYTEEDWQWLIKELAIN